MKSWKDRSRRQRMTMYVLGGFIALALVATVSIKMFLAPPSSPPSYDEERPELAEDGYISNTDSITIDLPADQVHHWFNDSDMELEDIIDSDDDFPEVVGTEELWGDWDTSGEREGARRIVNFADGHYLAEEVLIDNEGHFKYMIWGFTSYQRLAVDHGYAEFLFEDHGDSTEVTWTYSLQPRNAIVRPFLSNFVNGPLKTMMEGTLQGMKEGAEAELASS